MLTAEQVATALGCRPVTVRSLARKHNIGGRFGKAWAFTEQDVERMRNLDHVGGQPAHRRRLEKSA